ncbi:MAG: response regulator [Desulfobacteraceae bacterium]|nr:response regulator [Desulfobacteraceae bacterium]
MKPKRLLIVEDNSFIARDTKRKVTKLGYKVADIVSSGEEAVEKAQNDPPPDLILMDIILEGDIDGVEAARQINIKQHIPIIYVTAYASKDLTQRVKLTGPYGYITKPFKDEELQNAVEIAFYKQEMEIKLFEARKMKAIGILAGGLAHDFNNILFPIMGYAELLKEELPSDGLLSEAAEEIFIGAGRASEVVKQLMVLSRPETLELQPIKVQSVLSGVLNTSNVLLSQSVKLEQNIEDCGLILADASQLYQVIMNLITNACHAIGEKKGVLTIDLTEKDFHHDSKQIRQPYVCLSICDTGAGMDQEIMGKMFDPYFSTKQKHQGSGLGLSVVRSIVESYNGKVLCESEPGRGTQFEIFFPRIITDDIKITEPETASESMGTGQICFVNNDSSVTALGKYNLESSGYQVTSFAGSQEALDFIQKAPEKFDLIIADIDMPHMTGDVLISKVKKIQPANRAILFTDHQKKISKEKAAQMGVDKVLEKPVEKNLLVTAVQALVQNKKE